MLELFHELQLSRCLVIVAWLSNTVNDKLSSRHFGWSAYVSYLVV